MFYIYTDLNVLHSLKYTSFINDTFFRIDISLCPICVYIMMSVFISMDGTLGNAPDYKRLNSKDLSPHCFHFLLSIEILQRVVQKIPHRSSVCRSCSR